MAGCRKMRWLMAMLDRLYASLIRGPAINCRPHRSRQRIDWTDLARLQGRDPTQGVRELLSDAAATAFLGRVEPPREADDPRDRPNWHPDQLDDELQPPDMDADGGGESGEPARVGRQAYLRQRSLLTKLRNLGEDAKTYEQDTGVAALMLGFPLLSLPPKGGRRGAGAGAGGVRAGEHGGRDGPQAGGEADELGGVGSTASRRTRHSWRFSSGKPANRPAEPTFEDEEGERPLAGGAGAGGGGGESCWSWSPTRWRPP